MKKTEKDAFYFPHDSNAHDDEKCIILMAELGLEGYGAFWLLIELLREKPEYKCSVKLLPHYAQRYCVELSILEQVITKYDLFTTNDGFFYSESLMRRMEKVEQKREQARNAGLKSANRRQQREASKEAPILGVGEYIDSTGRRTYGTGSATIPYDAPPRPSERYLWNTSTYQWILL